MADLRENYCNVMLGEKFTGKSTELNKIAVEYNKRTGKRVLIKDTIVGIKFNRKIKKAQKSGASIPIKNSAM